jgi:hypothetical protein
LLKIRSNKCSFPFLNKYLPSEIRNIKVKSFKHVKYCFGQLYYLQFCTENETCTTLICLFVLFNVSNYESQLTYIGHITCQVYSVV